MNKSQAKIYCTYCGSNNTSLFAHDPREQGLHRTFYYCRGCGLYFAYPVASQSAIAAHYRNYYSEGAFQKYLDNPALERAALAEADNVLRRIREYHPRVKTLLDVGFGAGFLLTAANRSGLEVWGTEVSPETIKTAVERWKLPPERLLLGTLEQLESELPKSHFDVIFVWHVIEHVLDLDAFMSAIVALAAPDALLIIGTENIESLQQQTDRIFERLHLQRRRLPTAAEHTFGFTPSSLTRLVRQYGFEPISTRAYEDNWQGAYLSPPRKKSLAKRITRRIDICLRRYPSFYLSNWFGAGGKLEAFARKR